jgi:5-formyltetrahydrofolate cyclo-ligase
MEGNNELLDSIRKKHIASRDEMEAGAAYDASNLILSNLKSLIFDDENNTGENYSKLLSKINNNALNPDDKLNVQEDNDHIKNDGKNKKNKLRKNILLFYPVGRETAIHPIFRDLLKAGYNLYFPKIYKDRIEFFRINNLNGFVPGEMDIPEPNGNTDKWRNNFEGICIIPGVSFDRKGNRIGYGKGYYDKFLSNQKGLLKIGLCYEEQVENQLPVEDWDIPMNILITEAGIFDFTERHSNE